jgi:hypothetical protein
MITLLLVIVFFTIGLIIRPILSKYIRKQFSDFLERKYKTYEIKFRIEFYNQPSVHHKGEKGSLVKSPPIQIQIKSPNEEEALNILESIIKQEVKGELVSIKEV